MISRREFVDTLAVGAAGMAIRATAKSYSQIVGANERVNFAIIGLHSRGYAHLSALHANAASSRVISVCDVQTEYMQKFAAAGQKMLGYSSTTSQDFRKVLDSKDIDAISIATPDHWHTPMAIYGLKAGKHVYVEKPCSHNPAEGVLLVEAQKKYGKLVQMGTQQRSSPHTIEIVGRIHSGLIGRPYIAQAWYSNTRGSIGIGKETPVPAVLDWDLFQGPAPRRPYKDNIQPYNWHWFRIYGTGEALNNGTHEVDVCRWALGVDLPNRVTAAGGRYAYKDDWQFYDTLITSFEYDDKVISWEGKSCQGMKLYNRDRGSLILGTAGGVLVDRDGYEIYDLHGRKTDEFKTGAKTSSSDLVGADSMTDLHFANFIAGIRTGAKLNAPVSVGNISVTMLQLSNIAWETTRDLTIDPSSGHVRNNPEAMQLWSRTYEKGWAPTL
jgi:predicted dehydrogenase